MPLGVDLKRTFDAEVLHATNPKGEVALFRCLINAIEAMPGYRTCEIHGNKYQVKYIETEGWFTRKPQCELGDISIIAFSPRRNRARFVIVQNKLSYKLGGGLGTTTNEVKANLVQFELLSKRPDFEFARGVNVGVRNGLIKNSPCPSVCQYGIFYDSGAGVDMSVITANKFDLDSTYTRTSKRPIATVRFRGAFQSFAVRNSEPDFVAAETIRDFGDLLEDLYIGRPITTRVKRTINRLLLNMAYTHPDTLNMRVINDFCNMEVMGIEDADPHYENEGESGFENLLDVCRSLVLIDVDAETIESVNVGDCNQCGGNEHSAGDEK